MKTCRCCKLPKPLDEFSLEKLSKDGRRATCKDCINEKQSAKREMKEAFVWPCPKAHAVLQAFLTSSI